MGALLAFCAAFAATFALLPGARAARAARATRASPAASAATAAAAAGGSPKQQQQQRRRRLALSEAPTLTKPTYLDKINHEFTLRFTLPATPTAGTVKVSLRPTGAAAGTRSPSAASPRRASTR